VVFLLGIVKSTVLAVTQRAISDSQMLLSHTRCFCHRARQPLHRGTDATLTAEAISDAVTERSPFRVTVFIDAPPQAPEIPAVHR
jgi:hypothetical protein